MKSIQIDGQHLKLEQIEEVAYSKAKVKLSRNAIPRIKRCRKYVEEIVHKGQTVYGINTGFGKLCRVKISPSEIERLQKNLVLSHAVGVGPVFCEEEVRAAMLLQANVLSKGYSGVRVEVIQSLINLLNSGVTPMVPEKGSVGASGDLAPLAFIALVLTGEGWAFYNKKLFSGKDALKKAGLKPLKLSAKEGLALINGTEIMTGLGALTLLRAEKLSELADMAGALSCEAALATPVAFDEDLQKARAHRGQGMVAKNLVQLMKNSQIREFHKACPKVQDPYSFRCMPQVHGAVRDALHYVRSVLEVEINSATDNPLIFPDKKKVISGGNFHGEPVALALDFLGIAVSELGSISERRIAVMMDPNITDLPAFLVSEPGINSGLMMAQTTAAALVSENKILAHPASVDSIPTSLNQEDHVSMGTIASRKAREIANNTEEVLAIEFLCAYQGVCFRA
ncbi:MAG TPA: histidine ammonia-lyase, partial [Terriglobales bacterium]|nr:histidine ammonia-lyase [Terriglobales bacterium]